MVCPIGKCPAKPGGAACPRPVDWYRVNWDYAKSDAAAERPKPQFAEQFRRFPTVDLSIC